MVAAVASVIEVIIVKESRLYIPRKVCYAEMLYVERNIRSNRWSSWVLTTEAMVKAEAVGLTTIVSLGNARNIVQHYLSTQIVDRNVRPYQCSAEYVWTS